MSDEEDHDRLPTEWVPKPEGVRKLCAALDAPTDREGSRMLIEQLRQMSQTLEYSCYLCYVFTKYQEASVEVRLRAGLKLKSVIVQECPVDELPSYMVNYIKKQILTCIGVPIPLIRTTVASIISSIIYSIGFEKWPELLRGLYMLLSHSKPEMVDGAVQTLSFLAVDHTIDLLHHPQKPLDKYMPKWIELMECPARSTRLNALRCITPFIKDLPGVLMANFQFFLKNLFKLTSDTALEVALEICMTLRSLTLVAGEHLVQDIVNIVQYVLKATRSPIPELALTACEFWPKLAVSNLNIVAFDNRPELMRQLIASLLRCLELADSDPLLEDAFEPGTHPDPIKNIQPVILSTDLDDDNGGQEETDSDDEEYYGEDDAEASHQDNRDWTLRKCAAASLDRMSIAHGEAFLKLLLPIIQPGIRPGANWKHLDAALMALGSIAIGCRRPLESELPKMIPFVLSQLKHRHPIVRSTAAWVIQRFSEWIVHQKETDKYFRTVLLALLHTLLDESKLVQWTVTYTLRFFFRSAGMMMIPYLGIVVDRFVDALGAFQKRNTIDLLRTLSVLADVVGEGLRKAPLVEKLMTPLIKKWQNLPNDDPELLMLFSCLTSVAIAIGPLFTKCAKPFYERALKMLEDASLDLKEHPHDQDAKRVAIHSLDLISGISEALKNNFSVVLNPTAQRLIPRLVFLMEHPDYQIRQSAFSICGDLARFVLPSASLQPFIPQMVKILIKNIDPGEAPSVCNNATWATSEIARKVGSPMERVVPEIVGRVIKILKVPPQSLPYGLFQNVALAFGRIALVFPRSVAPHIAEFFRAFCWIITNCNDDDEKADAIRAVCILVNLNPQPVRQFFPLICELFVSWQGDYPEDIQPMIVTLLDRFRKSAGSPERWQAYFQKDDIVKPVLRQTLKSRFDFE